MKQGQINNNKINGDIYETIDYNIREYIDLEDYSQINTYMEMNKSNVQNEARYITVKHHVNDGTYVEIKKTS